MDKRQNIVVIRQLRNKEQIIKKKIFKEPNRKRELTGHSPYAFIIVGSTALNAKNLLKQAAAGLRYVRIGKTCKHRHLAGFERQQGKNGKTKLFRAYAIF